MNGTVRPKNLLVYYGYPNCFNSSVNQWSNEKVAANMAKYDLLVFADGLQSTSHPDHNNAKIIISRVKSLRPDALIFGYVTINQTMANFITKTNEWKSDMDDVDGIFLDEAGYDYGKTRDEFNERCIHVKSKEFICFANAWDLDYILGTNDNASYPNSTYNVNLHESLLGKDDWVMLESLAVNTSSYGQGYASASDWVARVNKALDMRERYDVNLAAVNVINNDNANGQDYYDFCHRAALVSDMDANGSSDTSYGSSSATVAFWDREDAVSEQDDIAIEEDASTGDIYYRYTPGQKITLDFRTDNQSSSFLSW